MKRVPHAAKVWDNVSTGSNMPFIVQLRLTDEAKFLGNLVIADLLQPEFQKPAVVKPACGIYYSFTQLRRVVVRAVTTHDFSKSFSVDLNSCVLTKFLAEYLVGLGRTVVIMHLNVEHDRCKKDLKSQEKELTRVTELLNLQKQRIEKLVVECSNSQQQLVREKNTIVDNGTHDTTKNVNKEQEKEGKDNDDPGYATTHLEQTNNLHIISNIPDDTATPDHKKHKDLTERERPNISLNAAWDKVQSIDAEFYALEQEERRRLLEIELITLRNRSNALNSASLNDNDNVEKQEEYAKSETNSIDSSDLVIIESLNKDEEQPKIPKNVPNISRHVDHKNDPDADDKEQSDNNSIDEDDEKYYAAIRNLYSRNGLDVHEYQQICDEMNRVFSENIQRYEQKEQQSKHDNHQLQMALNKVSREAKQYKEWFLEKQEMDQKLQEYEETSRKVNSQVDLLKSQLLQCNREISNYKEQAKKAEARWKEEKESNRKKSEAMEAKYYQLHNHVKKLHHDHQKEKEVNKRPRPNNERLVLREDDVLKTTNIIASTTKNQSQQEQYEKENERRIFALKNNDQGQLMYDTDDGEDIIMQSATNSFLTDNNIDDILPKQQHQLPVTSTSSPKMVKRKKLIIYRGDDTTMAESSSSSSVNKKEQSSSQSLPITSNIKNFRRRSSTSDNNRDNNKSNSRQEQQNSDSALGNYQQNIIEEEKPITRQPLKSINENAQGPQKKRRVSSKKK
ncbi:hypothetical protein INT45_009126 [Circinella minor]|uniref:Uncharacterized protein n=1 Tax=Circinella minor TaxID=1195481 RepID=A0A8H7VPC1_9FUNG|nr:hypothetical protein INT45_009126 [Circinella minor]